MERSYGMSTLRDNKVKEPWSYYHCYPGGGGGGGDSTTSSSCLLGGFPWPPRSYICSFCKREFKSAQALGGHMNVHRRDRARLRESPPWIAPTSDTEADPNPNPNSNHDTIPIPIPNLNHNPNADTAPSPASKLHKVTYTFPSLLSPLSHFPSSPASSAGPFSLEGHNPRTRKAMKALSVVGEVRGFAEEDKSKKIRREREVVRLDLEIGMCGDLEEEDLDLELRLGFA